MTDSAGSVPHSAAVLVNVARLPLPVAEVPLVADGSGSGVWIVTSNRCKQRASRGHPVGKQRARSGETEGKQWASRGQAVGKQRASRGQAEGKQRASRVQMTAWLDRSVLLPDSF